MRTLPIALLALALAASARADDVDVTGVVRGRSCTPIWSLVDAKPATPGAKAVCDPAHEKIALVALRRAYLVPADAAPDGPEAAEYLRGLAWNDDPTGELASSPARFAAHYLEVEKKALAGKRFGPGDDLLGRVHFGDLQGLHALAAVYGENAYDTFDDVIVWAELLYRVATGEIDGATPLAKAPVKRLARFFPKGKPATVAELLGVADGKGDAQKRALGALMHLVQESFLTGHVTRVDDGAVLGGVRAYNSDERHAGGRHAKDTGWRELWQDGGSIWDVKGGREALQRCTDVAFLVRGKREWKAAREYVEMQVLSLSGVKEPAKRKKDR